MTVVVLVYFEVEGSSEDERGNAGTGENYADPWVKASSWEWSVVMRRTWGTKRLNLVTEGPWFL